MAPARFSGEAAAGIVLVALLLVAPWSAFLVTADNAAANDGGNALENELLNHLNISNGMDDWLKDRQRSLVPYQVTKLVQGWVQGTYLSMAEYYALPINQDGDDDSKNKTTTARDFVRHMAHRMVEEVIAPGLDLCLNS